jgi:hypothetical protein
MNISVAITQFLGILLTIMGLSVAIDRKNMSSALEKIAQDRGFLWLWGFILLALGAALLVLNNSWTSGLPLLVTILAWLQVIKGAFLLLFPGPAVSLYRKFNKDSILMFGGIVAFVLGLVLLYLGFV